MKGIYLAAGKAAHSKYDIVYQDIDGTRDIGGDMLTVDLSQYDYILASPPCNYWSRCNYRRSNSIYALKTKMLLPLIIAKCIYSGKPFIVENVRNSKLFDAEHLYDFPCFIYFIGRHTYWTNILMPTDIQQRQDFLNGGFVIKYKDMKNCYHQGGYNVWQVFEVWLSCVTSQRAD